MINKGDRVKVVKGYDSDVNGRIGRVDSIDGGNAGQTDLPNPSKSTRDRRDIPYTP
jgi:hypothetical protein